MALKGDRHELQTDISSICNDVVVKGQFLFYKTAGSGIDLDDSQNVVTLLTGTNVSGNVPAGLVLNNTVSIDTTRQHVNFMKDEMIVGQHVTLLRQGWVVTDQIIPGTTPTAGDKAYVGYSGMVTNFKNASNYVGPVGEFMGLKDPDGFAKLAVHVPMQGY